MNENRQEKKHQGRPRSFSSNLCSLGGAQSLLPVGAVGSAVGEAIKKVYGDEGRIDVRVTNKTITVIKYQFINRKGESGEVELLESGLTRFFSKKARDGLGHTTKYELDIWWENKNARIFIFGENAPRDKNRYEVREQGIFLVEKKGGEREEFQVANWKNVENQ